MKLTFLGTGAGIPSKERNVSSLILNLLQEVNELWMFDCGEATQHQLLHTTFKPRKIKKVFITHLHGDHIFGLPGFLSSRSFLGAENDPLTIFGPVGIRQYVETALATSNTKLSYSIEYIEFHNGKTIYEDPFFIVDTIELSHNVPSFGYRITEKDRLGELNVQKLKELNIAPGPIYRQIKENEQTKLPDGRVIKREDVIGPMKKGKIVTIFGDTKCVPHHIPFAAYSDVLVHEATFSKENKSLAQSYHHSTTEEAALFAKEAKVKQLLLTHISSRYQFGKEKELEREAQAIFPNTTIVRDFYTFKIGGARTK